MKRQGIWVGGVRWQNGHYQSINRTNIKSVRYSLRDGNTVIIYLNYNTPIFCRFNITSIIEVEKDFKNCDSIIDAIQTAIDNNVIDKNKLPLRIKIYYK